MRKIPVTMATQHPDNSRAPYFGNSPFVSASEEIEECYRCFSELGVHEYMWDWEGKFVDEAVIDRMFQEHHDYFKKHPLGKELFLTFRIPNIWEEPSHRLPRAFINLISAEHAARQMKMSEKPLFEVILPMTKRADQLIYLQKKFSKIIKASNDMFDAESSFNVLNIIPLFEEVGTMAEADSILEEYVAFLQKEFKHKPEYLRVFLARSDPAMDAGLLPCMLAVKSAISSYHAFGEKHDIAIHPWIGGGSLPFRGGINPENIDAVLEEYKGLSSVTVQSAFRYDYHKDQVVAAIKRLNEEIPKIQDDYRRITLEEAKRIKAFNAKAKKFYQASVESIAPLINKIASKIPSHRERVQHVGLSGYFRGMGKVTLPRAIKFTGSLYSIGMPPEFIGLGRALQQAEKDGMLELIDDIYKNLRRDIIHAGHYLNRDNLELLISQNSDWKLIKNDIALAEKILGIEVGPDKTSHMIHKNLSSNIYYGITSEENTDTNGDILRAAGIRKSLG
jgi:phosphoenolpyruvate carboxylase